MKQILIWAGATVGFAAAAAEPARAEFGIVQNEIVIGALGGLGGS